MILIPLLAIPTLATAFLLPTAAQAALSSPNPNLSSKCTFTLFHRQQSSTNYIQLNTITDHANKITIDVASHRPATAFNSYTRLDGEHAFAVAGLLDDARLTVKYAGDGVLEFRAGDVEWSTGEANGGRVEDGRMREAWCDEKEWVGGLQRRVSCVVLNSLIDCRVLTRRRCEDWIACFLARRSRLRI